MDWHRQVAPEPHLKFLPIFPPGTLKKDNLSCVRWNTMKCHLSIPNPYNEAIIPLLSHWQSKAKTFGDLKLTPEKAGTKWQSSSDYNACETLALNCLCGIFSNASKRHCLAYCGQIWKKLRDKLKTANAVLLQRYCGKSIIRKYQVCGRGGHERVCFLWQVAFSCGHTHTNTHTHCPLHEMTHMPWHLVSVGYIVWSSTVT